MADSTQPTETVLFDRNAVAAQPVAPQPVATQSTSVTNQPAQFANQSLPVATGDNYQDQTPELSVDSNNLTSSQPYINNETNQPINAPVVEQSTYVESNSETEIPISDSSKNLEETSTTDLDSNAISTSEDVTGFNQDSSEVTVLHQPSITANSQINFFDHFLLLDLEVTSQYCGQAARVISNTSPQLSS